jgi:accessory gene regulator protein AgrB
MDKLRASVRRLYIFSIFSAAAMILPQLAAHQIQDKLFFRLAFWFSHIFPVILMFNYAFTINDQIVFEELNNSEKRTILLCIFVIIVTTALLPEIYSSIFCKNL